MDPAIAPVVAPGDRVRIRCGGKICRQWIDWTVPERWWESVPQFHSDECRDAFEARLNTFEYYPGCPHPQKVAYRHERDALDDLANLSLRYDQILATYRCRCGALHNGRLIVRKLTQKES